MCKLSIIAFARQISIDSFQQTYMYGVNSKIDLACISPIALRKAKIVNNFGLSECNRVKPLLLNLVHRAVF